MKNKNILLDAIIYLSAIALFFLCVYRAVNLSMTHDESSSFFFLGDSSILYHLTHIEPWNSANNHLLNTFLFQCSVRLFGDSEIAIRLPNVLAFVLYMFSTYKLGSHIFKDRFTLLCFFMIATANPYVFDFFCLARGYGLSLAFQMFSMLAFWKFLTSNSIKHFLLLLGSLFLMSFSLFSTLILIPSFLGALLLVQIQQKTLNRRLVFIGVGFVVLTALVFYTPLSALSGLGEFNFGAKSFFLSIQDFAERTLYSKKYFGPNSPLILVLALMVSIIGLVSTQIRQKALSPRQWYFRFLIVSTLLFCLGLIGSKLTLGTLYPIERKTLFFFPFATLILIGSIDHIKLHILRRIILGGIITLAVFHFYKAHQLNRTKEWWYDDDTKNMIYLLQEETQNKEIVLSVNWGFYPTTLYYLARNKMDNVYLTPYSKKLLLETCPDYFIGMPGDYKILKKDFEVLYTNKSSFRILKRKPE